MNFYSARGTEIEDIFEDQSEAYISHAVDALQLSYKII